MSASCLPAMLIYRYLCKSVCTCIRLCIIINLKDAIYFREFRYATCTISYLYILMPPLLMHVCINVWYICMHALYLWPKSHIWCITHFISHLGNMCTMKTLICGYAIIAYDIINNHTYRLMYISTLVQSDFFIGITQILRDCWKGWKTVPSKYGIFESIHLSYKRKLLPGTKTPSQSHITL